MWNKESLNPTYCLCNLSIIAIIMNSFINFSTLGLTWKLIFKAGLPRNRCSPLKFELSLYFNPLNRNTISLKLRVMCNFSLLCICYLAFYFIITTVQTQNKSFHSCSEQIFLLFFAEFYEKYHIENKNFYNGN